MSVGDTYYKWLSSGSTTAISDAAHNLFGSFSGLSLLSVSAVVHVQVQASGANFMLIPTDEASVSQDGQWFKEDINAYIDLPPMIRSDASQLSFHNLTAGDNAVARWVIWQRWP